MSIAIVTPTKNRPEQLGLVMECINNQTLTPDEWIISDNGDIPLSADFLSRSKVPITYIHRDCDVHPSVCFNFANCFYEAKSNICIAIEDDDYYPPEYVRTMVGLLTRDNMLACESRNTDYRLSTGYYFIRYTTDTRRHPGCPLFPMHSMAIRGEKFKEELADLLCKHPSHPWPDLLCCTHLIDNNKYPHVIVDFRDSSSVSLKDYGIGTPGLCNSHKENTGMIRDDNNFTMFKQLLGGAWKRYEKYLGTKRLT